MNNTIKEKRKLLTAAQKIIIKKMAGDPMRGRQFELWKIIRQPSPRFELYNPVSEEIIRIRNRFSVYKLETLGFIKIRTFEPCELIHKP